MDNQKPPASDPAERNRRLGMRRSQLFVDTLAEPRSILMLAGAVLLVFAGQFLMVGRDWSPESIRRYVSYAFVGLGVLLFAVWQAGVMSRVKNYGSDGSSFLDIDRSAQREIGSTEESRQIIDEIRRLASTVSADRADVESVIERVMKAQAGAEGAGPAIDSFQSQMSSISRILEEKSKLADEKASALLDRGVAYSKFGIGFFIIAIVAWQVVALLRGFETQIIFGIASSTVLFVFLQFLSSWFLKQYRHFVEVSTYLIEMKSVFDRYALLHMLVREASSGEEPDGAPMSALVAALKEEMRWPRARPGFTDDVYYAKDAIGATEEIVRLVRLSSSPPKSAEGK